MKFSIGILAYNEEKNIAATLHSLLEQSVFRETISDVSSIEIIVVPNATTDRTVEIAEAILKAGISRGLSSNVSYKIDSLKEAGKTNAWNQFVHRFSSKEADFLILMDADIQFFEPTVLEEMFRSLQANPEKWVNTGHPLKSLALKKNKTFMEKLSFTVSKQSKGRAPQLCGQLYMARADKLRKITLPLGTNGDDGIIAEMICTNLLTQPYDAHKMMIALPTPSHTFEAYLTPLGFIRHEREQIKATLGQQWLYAHLRSMQKKSPQPLGDYIQTSNETIPNWITQIYRENTVQAEVKWTWFIPSWMFFRRFRLLKQRPFFQSIFVAPVVLLASIIDWVVFYLVNKDLNLRTFEKYWRQSE